ncbi:hypothetical protein DXG01_015581 [Tephrocybe rancida]|nr:hypothetical protein DXG01_015581 [Tephrocybe rancida]
MDSMAFPISSSFPECYLTTIPLEILHHIAVDLVDFTPVGPPFQLVPLMQTCSALNSRLSPGRNPSLYGTVFQRKLDFGAAERRIGQPTPAQQALWGWRAFQAMSLFKRGDVRCCSDAALLEACRMGVMLMLDDDGKNLRQMLLWARADVFAQRLVMQRLYERSEENNGWPLETPLIAYALQLMWLLTSEESLRSEPEAVRVQVQQLLLPYIYAPFRYPTTPYPPNHYIIPPLLPSPLHVPTTIQTAHGLYPLYPPPIATPFTFHNGEELSISPPLPAFTARLLYLSRAEVNPLAIPPHLDRTRADRLARGLTDISPVREDLEEFDWGHIARPPLGTGLRTREGVRKAHPEWNGLEWADPFYTAAGKYPERPPAQTFPGFTIPEPIPRWVGKAELWDDEEKSRNWDMDLARMRAWADLDAGKSRKAFEGGVYELGSAEGLWVGRVLMTGPFELQALAENPIHPPHGALSVELLNGYPQFSYMRMRELHGLHGEATPPPLPRDATIEAEREGDNEQGEEDEDEGEGEEEVEEEEEEEEEPFALGPLSAHDGMNNAWFAGDRRPRVLPPTARQCPGTVRLEVHNVLSVGVYRVNRRFGGRWKDGTRLGNDAPPPVPGASHAVPTAGYAHDVTTCSRCKDDRAFEDMIRLAMGEPGANVHALLEKGRVRGRCNGVKEIVIMGETDAAHGAAFNHYVLEGRIRPADGLFLGLRRSKTEITHGTTLFWGYFTGKETLAGNWRVGGTDPGAPAWEGTFVWGRRGD